MTLDVYSFPIQNNDYDLTVLDDEVILFSVNHEKSIYLNYTEQLIWRLCDGETSIYELVKHLKELYSEEANIHEQVINILNEMVGYSAVSFSSASFA